MEYHIITSKKKPAQSKAKNTIEKIVSQNKARIKTVKNKSIKPSSRNWLLRHINDPFVQQAQKDNLISRASYKIIEINNKYKILKKQNTVIDVGAAPGGWSRAVWNEIAHEKSRLISVDLLDIVFQPQQNEFPENVHIIKGDFTEQTVIQEIQSLIPSKAHVMLSDIAPNTTGHSKADHLAIMQLIRQFINFAYNNLEKGGSIVFKIFEGEETKDVLQELRKNFEKVRPFKPSASRKNSPEMYIIANNYKG